MMSCSRPWATKTTIIPLQDQYTVEVKNRFTPLFEDEIDTIELELNETVELTKETARAAQRQGKRPPTSAAPGSAELNRRKKKDDDVRVSREQMAAIHKDKEQRKRDGKAALRRIAKKISLYDVRDVDVAKTVIMTEMSSAVRKLVEERHQWLREPSEAICDAASGVGQPPALTTSSTPPSL
ncbi:hypothetical protein MTO96_046553 [Rhipicephalus appendiculatus]